jgi:hypothetical protein
MSKADTEPGHRRVDKRTLDIVSNMLATLKSTGGRRWPPVVIGGRWWTLTFGIASSLLLDPGKFEALL